MLYTDVPMTARTLPDRRRSAQLKVVPRTLSSMRFFLCIVKWPLLAAQILGLSFATAFGQTVSSPSVADVGTNPVISLDDAIHRALANGPVFAAAMADSRIAQLDRSIARAGLLPSATFHNQYLFTQGNGSTDRIGQTTTSAAPRFIANNAVHEYASQAVVNETLGLQQLSAVTVADANAAKAVAELEVARRGLLSTVVTLYYTLAASESKLATAQHAVDEANSFVTLTQQREDARESAHADVLKAQLQQQQRVRDLADARLAATKAHLELGILLYPDPRTAFQTEASAPPNLPDLALNYTYGIDAPQFAVNGPDRTRNLGYSASATLDLPLWDWLATEHKVKQSEIRRDAAKVALSAAQRSLVADLAEFYDEAAAARDQLASLDLSAATARESLRLTRLRYENGEGTVLDVVDAENSLVSAENARADGVVRYQTALANLQTLTGRF